MFRFEYSIVTKASPSRAWDIFSNWHRWATFANIYGDLRWREGEPWKIGSHLEIEILRPVETVVDHLIISCEPASEIGWIDRALGITLGQWVKFEPQGPDQTRIRTWGELAPAGVEVAGRTVERLVTTFVATWYQNFRITCDRLVGNGI